MRIKTGLVLWGLAGAGLVLGFGQDKPPTAEKAAAAKASKPLIRMDLLQKGDRNAAFVKRDIFIPQSDLGLSGTLSAPPGVRMAKAGAAGESAAPEPQALSLNVRYLGFIQSKQKMTALVLFEGQAVAVAEGDALGPAWKVVKISAGLIEIQGEDGKSQTFALEGERK
jgi:hypothetical protein